MEAVAPGSLGAVGLGDGVGAGFGRHGAVEDGVEACEVGDVWQALHRLADDFEGFGIVKRGEG